MTSGNKLKNNCGTIKSLKIVNNKQGNCSGPPEFKNQRVGYPSNQKSIASLSACKKSAQLINSFLRQSRF